MLTESHALGIAAEVEGALSALLQHNPTVVWQFEQTFHARSALVGFIESRSGTRGIVGALAELLPTRFSVTPEDAGTSENLPDEKFVADLRFAVQRIAETRPLAILILKKNQLRQKCSLEEALAALFADYRRRATAYPY